MHCDGRAVYLSIRTRLVARDDERLVVREAAVGPPRGLPRALVLQHLRVHSERMHLHSELMCSQRAGVFTAS